MALELPRKEVLEILENKAWQVLSDQTKYMQTLNSIGALRRRSGKMIDDRWYEIIDKFSCYELIFIHTMYERYLDIASRRKRLGTNLERDKVVTTRKGSIKSIHNRYMYGAAYGVRDDIKNYLPKDLSEKLRNSLLDGIGLLPKESKIIVNTQL